MSKTQENLLKAFAGESMARNKYTLFAKKAREENYEQIAAIFEETADNERAHAERLLSFLSLKTPVTLEFAGEPLGDTRKNLEMAIEGEHYENTEMYPGFEKIAQEEGFSEIADVLKEISEVEEHHEKRYRTLLKNLIEGKVFKKDVLVKWKCRNCGYVHEGLEAPDKCPACGYEQKYYELLCENY